MNKNKLIFSFIFMTTAIDTISSAAKDEDINVREAHNQNVSKTDQEIGLNFKPNYSQPWNEAGQDLANILTTIVGIDIEQEKNDPDHISLTSLLMNETNEYALESNGGRQTSLSAFLLEGKVYLPNKIRVHAQPSSTFPGQYEIRIETVRLCATDKEKHPAHNKTAETLSNVKNHSYYSNFEETTTLENLKMDQQSRKFQNEDEKEKLLQNVSKIQGQVTGFGTIERGMSKNIFIIAHPIVLAYIIQSKNGNRHLKNEDSFEKRLHDNLK